MISIKKMLWLRALWIAIFLALVAISLRYPFYAFLDHFSEARGGHAWEHDFVDWCVWDCTHYSRMSGGYRVDDVIYFPGFPWTISGLRALAPGFSGHAATLLTSNLFSILALALITVFMALMNYGAEWLRRFPWDWKTWFVPAFMAVFPTSHFWSSGYAEAEQLVAFLLAFIMIVKGRWVTACAISGLGALIRIQSVWFVAVMGGFIVIDQLLMFISKQKGENHTPARIPLSPRKALLCCFLLVLPFSAFMIWQWIGAGDPLLFIHKMQTGGRPNGIFDVIRFHRPRFDISFILLMLSHIAAFRFIRRPQPIWKILALTSWVLAIPPLAFGGFSWGYGRYMSCNVAIFILLGEWMAMRPWLTVPVFGWSVFRLAMEVKGWTEHLWRG